MALSVVILAAGQGTRMKSALPKVLQPLAGSPMLGHVLETAAGLDAGAIHVVYGFGGERVVEAFPGRDVSWVSRRLSLIKALPEDLLEQVRQGRISLWAATRILAPLARANAEHARTLLAQLEHQPLSTRELKRLYSHYRQANRVQRQRLVDNPGLFLQAVESRAQESADKRLAAGPEGDWCKDLTVVAAILKRLTRQVPTLFAATQDALERERLQHAFTPTKTQFQRLEWALAQTSGDDR